MESDNAVTIDATLMVRDSPQPPSLSPVAQLETATSPTKSSNIGLVPREHQTPLTSAAAAMTDLADYVALASRRRAARNRRQNSAESTDAESEVDDGRHHRRSKRLLSSRPISRSSDSSDNDLRRASNHGNPARLSQHRQRNVAEESDAYSTTSSRRSTSSNAAAFELMASAFQQLTAKLDASISAAADRVTVGTTVVEPQSFGLLAETVVASPSIPSVKPVMTSSLSPHIAAVDASKRPETVNSPSLQSDIPLVRRSDTMDSGTSRKSATIRLGMFDGRNQPVETHLAKLANISSYYGWSASDRLHHLKASLEGNAAAVLYELNSSCTEADLVTLLRNRYGSHEMTERFRFELKLRRRKKGEPIQSLYNDVARLVSLAYPGETSSLAKLIARDAFLDSLDNTELKIKALEKGCNSIDEAYGVIARYETYTATTPTSNETSDSATTEETIRRRARAVNQTQSSADNDRLCRLEAAIARLENTVSTRRSPSIAAPAVATVQQQPQQLATPASYGWGPEYQVQPTSFTSSPVQPPATRGGRGRGARGTNRGRGGCFTCGDPSHWSRECPTRQQAYTTLPTGGNMQAYGANSPNCHSEIYIDAVVCNGRKNIYTTLVFDSGCCVSVCPRKYVSDVASIKPTNLTLTAANNSSIPVLGTTRIKFVVNKMTLYADVLVSEACDELLIGYGWMKAHGCVWDFDSSTLCINGSTVRLSSRPARADVKRVYVSESVLIERRSITDIPVRMACLTLRATASNWLLEPKSINGVALAARTLLSNDSNAFIRVINASESDQFVNKDYCIGTAESVDLGCGYCKGDCKCDLKTTDNLLQTNRSACSTSATVVTARNSANCSSSMIVNASDCHATSSHSDVIADISTQNEIAHPSPGGADYIAAGPAAVTSPTGSCAAAGQQCSGLEGENMVSGNTVAQLSNVGTDQCVRMVCNDSENDHSLGQDNNEDLMFLKPLLDTLPDDISDDDKRQITNLLLKNVDLFARYDYDVGLSSLMKCKLELLPGAQPVSECLRRHPIAYLETIDEEVNKLLAAGLIVPSVSPWSSNIVVVKRKDGRARITVDYRRVNRILRKISYPLPSCDTIFDALEGSFYYTTLDLANAYLGLELEEDSSELTTFCTRTGSYRWTRMCPGLSTGTANFCMLMRRMFGDSLWKIALAFLDDVVVPSKSVHEGIDRLSDVLDKLRSGGLKLKLTKCKLLQKRTKILGFIVSGNSIEMDPERISAVERLHFPRSIKELRSLLGFANWGRQFHRNFASVAAPLTDCLKNRGLKGPQVVANEHTLLAFQNLKRMMLSPPVLTMFRTDSQLVLETDASDLGVGACLKSVAPNGEVGIIAYASKVLNESQRKLSVTRRELYAIIFALERFKTYLLGRHFTIYSDHNSLQFLTRGKCLTPQLARYLDFMADFDFAINFKRGVENNIADLLSRIAPCEEDEKNCEQCNVEPRVDKVRSISERQGQTQTQVELLESDKVHSSERHDDEQQACCIMDAPIETSQLISPLLPSNVATAGLLVDISTPASQLYTGPEETFRVQTRGERRLATNEPISESIQPVDAVQNRASEHLNAAAAAASTGNTTVTGNIRRPTGRRKQGNNLMQQVAPLAADQLEKSNFWPRDFIIDQQSKDPILAQIKGWLLSDENRCREDLPNNPELKGYFKQIESMVLIDDIMYRQFYDLRGSTKFHQLLLPATMRESFLELCHASALAHCKTVSKNNDFVQKRAYWLHWQRDVRLFVGNCNLCMQYFKGKLPRLGPLIPQGCTIGRCGFRLSIDLVGRLPPSQSYHYLLTCLDGYSKYLILVPLRDKTANAVAHALLHHVFLKYGFYDEVLSDNGPEFINSILDELYQITGTRRLRTTAYKPSSNPSERSHSTIHSLIAKMVDKHSQWSQYIDYVAAAYNRTIHKATQFTPNQIQFGRELGCSFDAMLENPTEQFNTTHEFVAEMMKRSNYANELVRETLHATAMQSKRYYDSKLKASQHLNEGDVCLVYSPRRYTSKCPKWQRLFCDQCTIKKRLNAVTFLIQINSSKKCKIVHVDKLKLMKRAEESANAAE